MRFAMAQLFEQNLDFAEALKSYQIILYGKGYSGKAGGALSSGSIRAERLEAILKAGGHISPHELLRMRVRYFTDGMVLGSKAFIEFVFLEHRGLFGVRRLSAGTALSGGAWGDLHTMRNLKKSVYTDP